MIARLVALAWTLLGLAVLLAATLAMLAIALTGWDPEVPIFGAVLV